MWCQPVVDLSELLRMRDHGGPALGSSVLFGPNRSTQILSRRVALSRRSVSTPSFRYRQSFLCAELAKPFSRALNGWRTCATFAYSCFVYIARHPERPGLHKKLRRRHLLVAGKVKASSTTLEGRQNRPAAARPGGS